MVLCAPTTYSESGRQPSENEFCEHCSGAMYWGATFCPGTTPTKQPISVLNGAVNAGVSVSEADVDKIKLIYESCGGECLCVSCFPCQSHLFTLSIGRLVLIVCLLTGDNWIHNDNWMSSQNICSWYGIECSDENAVESIILSANNLKGVFPPNIFFLPNLQTL